MGSQMVFTKGSCDQGRSRRNPAAKAAHLSDVSSMNLERVKISGSRRSLLVFLRASSGKC